MATPEYFQNFKDIDYAVKIDKAGNTTNITIKDYFRMMRLRDDVFREDTYYIEYVVKNGESPDVVSKKFYDDEQYYWVILQINGIMDYYDQWPLTTHELEEFITKKYGVEGAGDAHHYETIEVKDADGRVLLPAGMKVTENYVFRYVDSTNPTVELTSTPDVITNRQYEVELNQQKAAIQILHPKYILDFAREYSKWVRSQPAQMSEVDISESIG